MKFILALLAAAQLSSGVQAHTASSPSQAAYMEGRQLLEKGNARAAAKSFLEGYRAEQRGEHAPASLFYLGKALYQLGNSAQACNTYRELNEAFGSAMPADVRLLLPQAVNDAGCTAPLSISREQPMRDASPADFVGEWLTAPTGGGEAQSYLRVTIDAGGAIQVWNGIPGMTGAGEVSGNTIGNMWILKINTPNSIGDRSGTYTSMGESFKGGVYRLQGKTLAQTVPTRVMGRNVRISLMFRDRDTIVADFSSSKGANSTDSSSIYKRIDGANRNVAIEAASRRGAAVVQGMHAKIAREEAEKKSEGGGLLGALQGAVAGIQSVATGGGGMSEALSGAAIGGVAGAAGVDAGTIGSALGSINYGSSGAGAGVASALGGAATGGGSFAARQPLSMPGCDAVGVNQGNYRAAALSGGKDVQLKTMCGQAFEYYSMYKNAIAQGYSEADANRTYAAHEKSALVANDFYANNRAE